MQGGVYIMRANVDKELCISCGLCISICDEVFEWGDDDKAEAIEEEVPEHLEEDIREAIESCPTEAIEEI